MPADPAMAGIEVKTVTGAALRDYLPALNRLHATVFRDWPYLYGGEPDDENPYHTAYAQSPAAGLVIALADGEPVGAATCLPLQDEAADVQAPFLAQNLDLDRFFYFGESVLLPAFRGRGIGVKFFEHREAHAKAVSDAELACFCAVQRPPDHPLRPADAVSLEPFWQRRGYSIRPDLVCTMDWPDLGETEDTPKQLVFWVKTLRPAPAP